MFGRSAEAATAAAAVAAAAAAAAAASLQFVRGECARPNAGVSRECVEVIRRAGSKVVAATTRSGGGGTAWSASSPPAASCGPHLFLDHRRTSYWSAASAELGVVTRLRLEVPPVHSRSPSHTAKRQSRRLSLN